VAVEDFVNKLNEAQKEAVLTTEGPILVIAGAGSGKTRVLTHRLAYLVKEKNISPFNILAVTFTNKAAQEMGERISNLLTGHSEARLPWLGTFHSVCVGILRREIDKIGYGKNFVIYDTSDSTVLVKRIIKSMNLDPKEINPNTVRNMISSAKCEMLDPEQYKRYTDGYFQEKVADIYVRYQASLKEANALDFDDLLNVTNSLFDQCPEVLFKYQDQFQYVLIDEYQDTNQSQYLLVKRLADKHRNICVVGDDYQAIYSWRGANFKNILNFEKDYPKAKVVKLEQNYRSSKNIIAAADAVIQRNNLKTDKKMWTDNEDGAPLVMYNAVDEKDEVEFITGEIEAIEATGAPYKTFAVLYRTNAQSRALEEGFLRDGVPYRIIGALRFYERKEIKDILAYLKLITNENDLVSLERIINVPTRGIGAKTVEKFLVDRNSTNEKIERFFMMIAELRSRAQDMSVADLIDLITIKIGYRDYVVDGSVEGESRWENIEELKTVAYEYENLDSFLREYLWNNPRGSKVKHRRITELHHQTIKN
jgi:DNA helicase-2/ATP-dependent DNA helicase PcrA